MVQEQFIKPWTVTDLALESPAHSGATPATGGRRGGQSTSQDLTIDQHSGRLHRLLC
jgi:hypothetical protein